MFKCVVSSSIILCMSVMSIMDIRFKKLDIKTLLVLMLLCLCMVFDKIQTSSLQTVIINVILSLFVGIIILCLSILTKGGIGKGDAFIFLILALILEWYENLLVFVSGILIASIIGIAILTYKKANGIRDKQIFLPFVPFILPAICYIIYKKYGISNNIL